MPEVTKTFFTTCKTVQLLNAYMDTLTRGVLLAAGIAWRFLRCHLAYWVVGILDHNNIRSLA